MLTAPLPTNDLAVGGNPSRTAAVAPYACSRAGCYGTTATRTKELVTLLSITNKLAAAAGLKFQTLPVGGGMIDARAAALMQELMARYSLRLVDVLTPATIAASPAVITSAFTTIYSKLTLAPPPRVENPTSLPPQQEPSMITTMPPVDVSATATQAAPGAGTQISPSSQPAVAVADPRDPAAARGRAMLMAGVGAGAVLIGLAVFLRRR